MEVLTMLEILRKKEQRFKYLKTLYTMVGGSPQNTANHYEVQIRAGLEQKEAEEAFYYLLEEKFLKASYLAELVQITHAGVKYCEHALEKCGERDNNKDTGSTTHVTIGQVTNSNVEVANRNISCCKTPDPAAVNRGKSEDLVPAPHKRPASTLRQNNRDTVLSGARKGWFNTFMRFIKEQLLGLVRKSLLTFFSRLFLKK